MNTDSLTLRWTFSSPVRAIALGFGSGLLRPAPGTWGTLCGWLLWWLFVGRLDMPVLAGFWVLSFLYGCWACQRVGGELQRTDDSRMVWDEIVAFWLVLAVVPASFFAQLAGFLLFRFFDIVKPFPIRFFDVRLANGFGVMLDDLLAAGYSLLIWFLLVRFGVFL